MPVNITMKELLEAGVHFGHQTRRWDPKMKDYIFGERNGIHIIDLQKTLKKFKEAARYVTELASQGKRVLFVGTKRQAQEAIAEEAQRCGMFWVNHRWLGGTLTNWATLQKSIERYKELQARETEGTIEDGSKKEASRLRRQLRHFHENLAGLKELPGLPDVLFVVDAKNESIAIKEARKLSIPIVAVVDTNSNPEEITYAIPGNDDALRAIRLFSSKIADAVLEGHALCEQAAMEAQKVAEEEALAEAQDGVEEYVHTSEELEVAPASTGDREIETEVVEKEAGKAAAEETAPVAVTEVPAKEPAGNEGT